MPDETVEPIEAMRAAARYAFDLAEFVQGLVHEWPSIGHDRDLFLCAGLSAEVLGALMRGDADGATATATKLCDVAEAAVAAAYPVWRCPECGDTVPYPLAAEHTATRHR